MEFVWRAGWLFAGHSCQIRRPGEYFLYDVDGDSLIIVRGNEWQLSAFYNVCRHRGSIICEVPNGNGQTLHLPIPSMDLRPGRAPAALARHAGRAGQIALGLHAAHAREVGGQSLSAWPPSRRTSSLHTRPLPRPPAHRVLAGREVARSNGLRGAANWKLVWENNRECYHCNVNHPQYIKSQLRSLQRRRHHRTRRDAARAVTSGARPSGQHRVLAVTRLETGMTEFPDPEHNIW